MNEIYNNFMQIWGTLLLSALSLIIAIISLAKSSKAQKLQNKVNELEVKLKENELAKINEEKELSDKANVEARVINLGKNSNKLKIWNSGNVSAYNVSAKFEEGSRIVILHDDKMPFDELEPNKSFEVNIITYMGSASKFRIITEWNDKTGNHCEKSQMGSR